MHTKSAGSPNSYDCFWAAHVTVAYLPSNTAAAAEYARFSAQFSHGVS